MHVDGVLAVGGLLHELGRGAPIHVRGVLGKELLLERLDALVIAGSIELGALLHGGIGRPALGDDDVSALEGLLHGVHLLEGGTGLGGVGTGGLDAVAHEVIALGMRERDVHAEARQKRDERLRAGEWLAVGGRVSPGHGNLLAAQVL